MKLAFLLPGYLDSPDYLHMITFEKGLKKLGYIVERIDSCNLWKTGRAENYTITNMLKQIRERIDFYSKENPEEVVIIGHSRGAMTAIIAGSKISEITKVVALCPPDSIKTSTHKWENKGVRVSKRDVPGRPGEFREFAIPYVYVEDALKYSASESVKKLMKPLMVFIALDDVVVPPEITERIVENANDPYVVRQSNMGHDFRHSQKECDLVMRSIKDFLSSKLG